MHDRDKLCLELGLHVVSNVFYGGGSGVVGCERRVYDYTEAFHLQVGLVQGFEGTAIVEVVTEWDDKVGVHDSGGKDSVFGGGRE